VEVSVGLSALGGRGVGWWRHARGGMERRRVELRIGNVEEGSVQWMDVSRHFSSSDKVVAIGKCCLDMLHSSLRRLASLGAPTPAHCPHPHHHQHHAQGHDCSIAINPGFNTDPHSLATAPALHQYNRAMTRCSLFAPNSSPSPLCMACMT
jgi:hypothetical protein